MFPQRQSGKLEMVIKPRSYSADRIHRVSAFRNATHLGLVCLQIPLLSPAAKLLNGIEKSFWSALCTVDLRDGGRGARGGGTAVVQFNNRVSPTARKGRFYWAWYNERRWCPTYFSRYSDQLLVRHASWLTVGLPWNGERRFLSWGLSGRNVNLTPYLCVLPGVKNS